MLKIIKNTARFIIPLLLLSFISINIFQNKILVSSYWKNFDWLLLLISLVFMILVYLEAGLNWHELIKRIDYPLGFKKSLYIFIISNTSRYIPGSIWQYIGRVELAKRVGGIPRKAVILSLVLEVFILVNAALISSLLALPYLNQDLIKSYFWILIIPLSLILFHPDVFKFCIRVISKVTKREIGDLKTLKPQKIILTLPFFIFNFLLNGVALFFLAKSIYPQIGFENILFFSGIFAFSWAVGFLSLFAPAGLGVSDLLLVYLLSFQMPLTLASIIALSYRVFLTIAELIVFLFVVRINFYSNRVNYSDTKKDWERRSVQFGNKIEGVATKSLPPQVNKELDDWMLGNIQKIVNFYKNKSIKVLDLGCGYGRLSKPLLNKFENLKTYGIDVSQNYVKLYNKNLRPRGSALEGDIRKVPYKNNHFNVVFMVTTLMYLVRKEDRRKAIREILRVLRPGGKAVVIERSPSGYFLFTFGGLVNIIRGKKNQEISAVSINKEELKEGVKLAGGVVDTIVGIPFLSLFSPASVILYKLRPNALSSSLDFVNYLDKKFKSFLWPSLYLSYTISKPR